MVLEGFLGVPELWAGCVRHLGTALLLPTGHGMENAGVTVHRVGGHSTAWGAHSEVMNVQPWERGCCGALQHHSMGDDFL